MNESFLLSNSINRVSEWPQSRRLSNPLVHTTGVAEVKLEGRTSTELRSAAVNFVDICTRDVKVF